MACLHSPYESLADILLDLFLKKVGEYTSIIGPNKDLKFMFKKLWERSDVQNRIQVTKESSNKSDLLALSKRKSGNYLFKDGCFLPTLDYYNQSIVHSNQPEIRNIHDFKLVYDDIIAFPLSNIDAKFNFPNLALGYANRSAVLLELNNFEGCLLDISRSLYYGYPSSLKPKLVERQAKCCAALNQGEKAKEILKKFLSSLPEDISHIDGYKKMTENLQKLLSKCEAGEDIMEYNMKTERYEALFKIPIPEIPNLENFNPEVPAASEAISLGYASDKGRYFFANRDIMPGELLMKEEPICATVLDSHLQSHCSNCFIRTKTPVPCPFCINVIFCSEKCIYEGLKRFHFLECSVLTWFLKLDAGDAAFAVLRLMMELPLKEFKRKIIRCQNNKRDAEHRGFNDENIYLSTDYETIYNLVDCKEKRDVMDLFKRGIKAVCLVKILQKIDYFGENANENYEVYHEDIVLVGSVLFQHLLSFPCNSFSINELGINMSVCGNSVAFNSGGGVYSTLSLINHSCYPCACIFDSGKTKTPSFIIYSNRESNNYFLRHALRTISSKLQNFRYTQSIFFQLFLCCLF